MLEARIDLWNTDEVPLLQAFVDALKAHRNARYPGSVGVAGAEDVPPVPLEKVIDEVYENTRIEPAPAPVEVFVPPPASEAEAFAAMQAAVGRGAQLPQISALLNARNVTRVVQLSDADRASFVAECNKLAK